MKNFQTFMRLTPLAANILPVLAQAQYVAPFSPPAFKAPWTVAKSANLSFIRAEAAMLSKPSEMAEAGVATDSSTASVTVKPGANVFGPIIVITDIQMLPTVDALRKPGAKK